MNPQSNRQLLLAALAQAKARIQAAIEQRQDSIASDKIYLGIALIATAFLPFLTFLIPGILMVTAAVLAAVLTAAIYAIVSLLLAAAVALIIVAIIETQPKTLGAPPGDLGLASFYSGLPNVIFNSLFRVTDLYNLINFQPWNSAIVLPGVAVGLVASLSLGIKLAYDYVTLTTNNKLLENIDFLEQNINDVNNRKYEEALNNLMTNSVLAENVVANFKDEQQGEIFAQQILKAAQEAQIALYPEPNPNMPLPSAPPMEADSSNMPPPYTMLTKEELRLSGISEDEPPPPYTPNPVPIAFLHSSLSRALSKQPEKTSEQTDTVSHELKIGDG